MRIRVLGSGAGGGVPQWNCRCAYCERVRTAPSEVRPRTHTSIAVSADGDRWLICNASPDIHHQIEAFPELLPHDGVRGTSIGAIALTGADLDQILGLLLLREDKSLRVYGTERVRSALHDGLRVLPALANYGGVAWESLTLDMDCSLADRTGAPLGLRCRAFPVAGGPPPYAGHRDQGQLGDTVGLLITDALSGATVAFVPSCGALTDQLTELLSTADCVLFDATLWTDDDITVLGVPGRTGKSMMHMPLAEPGGTLDQLRLPHGRHILIHINNTNPLLVEGGPEQRLAASRGWEVAYDGLELEL
ncbi:MAG: pyrroloquinoline quinone biosynthesis protein PqqB [Chloroflexi bacterium]|nr:pyrroloquinoline quinone biosynthesis protein PqqB [Chloroflexota bacterium]MDB5074720.1 pyrroloquinoline quinone biosynthesis protein PqqB [Chloroflexota bacterium]